MSLNHIVLSVHIQCTCTINAINNYSSNNIKAPTSVSIQAHMGFEEMDNAEIFYRLPADACLMGFLFCFVLYHPHKTFWYTVI